MQKCSSTQRPTMRNPRLTDPLNRPPFRRLATTYAVNELGDWMGIVALSVLVFDRTGSALATAALFLGTRLPPGPARAGPRRAGRAAAAALRPAGHLLRRGGGLRRPRAAGRQGLLAGRRGRAGGDRRGPGADRAGADPGGRGRHARARPASCAPATRSSTSPSPAAPPSARPSPGWWSPASASSPRCCSTPSPSTPIAWILLTAGPLPQAEPDPGRLRERVRAGLAYIREQPTLRKLLIAQGAAFVFFAAVIPVEVVYAKETLGAGDFGYGLLLASWGAGMVLGSVVFATMRRAPLPVLLFFSTLDGRRRLPRDGRGADPGRSPVRRPRSAAPATACSG